jgi:hypothetical protein
LIVLVLATSCKYFELKKDPSQTDAVAQVGDSYLLKSELMDIYTSDMNEEDSMRVRQNFIENWARRQIILQKAKYNLTDREETELEDMISGYREDLYINAYREALVAQNLDSIIDQGEIDQFYVANNQIFKLNENLLQYRLVSYPKGYRKASRMRTLFSNNDSISINRLMTEDFTFQTMQLNDSAWVSVGEFLLRYPSLDAVNRNLLLRRNTFEFTTNDVVYYVIIKNVLGKGDIAPIERVSQDIVKMIYHQNKLKFLQNLDNQLIQEAIENKTYQKFQNE